MDLFPTLLSLAGLDAKAHADPSSDPSSAQDPLAPFDLSPAILDPAALLPAEDRMFYFHSARMGYLTPRSHEGQVIEAISDGRTKFVAERYDAPKDLLYDLGHDPHENHPVETSPDDPDGNERLRASRARLAEVRSALLGG
jgi:arylsulfatase A-like enzyme